MRVLIADIVTGRVGPGDRLPREQDLAEQFDVSRGVTRECIRAMEERGLISVKHGRGATVNEPEHWDMFDPDVLALLLEGPGGAGVLTEYLECRRILEVGAAALAAERATDATLRKMADALARMEEATTLPPSKAAEKRFHEADLAFHQALISSTGNRALGRLVKTIHAALLAARYPLARPQYRTERALPEHQRIMDAVRHGDVEEARAAMEAHLATVGAYLREYADEHALAGAPDAR